MSALAELDRYIKENEVTLYSINQKKLAKKSFTQLHSSNEIFGFAHHSAFLGSRTAQDESSVENELNNFIVRLQQMQQFRLKQLQQVNALFTFDMDIEDQFDLNVATAADQNAHLAEEDFEAFLLGESKGLRNDVIQPEESRRNFVPPPPQSQSTLFSKRSLSLSPDRKTAKQPTTRNDYVDGETNSESIESKSAAPDEIVGFTDDVIIQLKKNRLERSMRLKNIAKSIQTIGLTEHVHHSDAIVNTTTGNRKSLLEMSALSKSTEEQLLNLRRDVLCTSNYSYHQPHSQLDNIAKQSQSISETFVEDVPPPPPPPPSLPPPREAAANSNSSCADTGRNLAQSEAAITLQSILEDEQYDVSGAAATDTSALDPSSASVQSAPSPASYVPSGANFDAQREHITSDFRGKLQAAQESTESAAPTMTATCNGTVSAAAGAVAAPFQLVSNTRRRAIEAADLTLAEALEAKQNDEENNNLSSISSIYSHPQSNPLKTRSTGNTKSTRRQGGNYAVLATTASAGSKRNTSADHYQEIVGIGFGERYNKEGEIVEEAGEISSIGSQDSGESGNLSYMRRSGNKLFDYADQLESPVKGGRKKNANTYYSVSFAASACAEVGNEQQGNAREGGSNSTRSVQNAAQFTHHVTDYYERRLRSLEASGGYEGSPSNIRNSSSRSSSKNISAHTAGSRSMEEDRESPEQPSKSTAASENNFSSPTPKTPTFAPLFS